MKNRFVDKKLIKELQRKPCEVCGTIDNCEPHHVKSVATGGPDIKENLMPICFKHHSPKSILSVHYKGLMTFARDNSSIKIWLELNGWEQNFDGKWFNNKVNDIIKKYSKI